MDPKQADGSSHKNSSEPRGLLSVLFSAFSGVLFGLFLSKLRTPIRQSIQLESTQDNADNKDDTRQNIPRSPVRVHIESFPPSKTPPEEKKIEKKRDRRPQWGILAVNLLTLVAVIAYAYITKNMWKEMQDQTCIQRHAAMNAERAWVGLDGSPSVNTGLLEDGRLGATITFTVKNYGKGPALSVMAGAEITPSNPDNRHAVEDTLETTCNLMSPFVGVEPTRPVSSTEDLAKHQWGHVVFPNQPFSTGTITTIDMSKMAGKEVYVVGCIVYRDQFSEPHWTKFCYNTGDFAKDVVKDTSSFKRLYMCNANNYTDDVKKKPSCPVSESPK